MWRELGIFSALSYIHSKFRHKENMQFSFDRNISRWWNCWHKETLQKNMVSVRNELRLIDESCPRNACYIFLRTLQIEKICWFKSKLYYVGSLDFLEGKIGCALMIISNSGIRTYSAWLLNHKPHQYINLIRKILYILSTIFHLLRWIPKILEG